MEQNIIDQKSGNKNIISLIVGVLAATLVAGGSVYAYQRSQQAKFQQSLQSQIDTLKAQIASADPATLAPKGIPSVVPILSPVPTLIATPTVTLKTLAWNPTDGSYPGKVNTDEHMSVQYPSDCTTIAFAPAPPTSGATLNTSAEVDCQRDGGTLKLVFVPNYTNADPKNPPYVLDGTAYSTDPNVHATLLSNTTLSTKNGLYSRVLYNVDYSPNRGDGIQEIKGQLDYLFKNDISGLGALFKNKTELEASAFVPTNASATQLKVLDDMMQTLSCSGTGCIR